MEYKVYDEKSYRIHTIKTDKFKSCSMEIMFRNKIDKDKITENILLADVLAESSKKYPKRREISMELEDLYSAHFRAIASRIGNSFMIDFVMDFLNPKYCEEGYLDKVIEFPFEIILNPHLDDNGFNQRSFNIRKNFIKSEIESVRENPTRYAFKRSLFNMDKDSPSSYSMAGYLEDLENITPKSLVDTYHDVLNNYTCDIYIIGNLDMSNIVKLIKKYFKIKSIKNNKIDMYVKNKSRSKSQNIVEKGKCEQDSFIMIYNLEKLDKRERDYTIRLYNMILGSGGLTSKLYRYLREENSLCYTVSSMYQKYDSLLIIYSGIDSKDKAKCEKLVKKAMTEMIKGDFEDSELENAKKSIVSSIKMNEDTPGGIIDNYLFNELDGVEFYDERVKIFNSITREEIIKVANKVKLNTVYLYKGEEK